MSDEKPAAEQEAPAASKSPAPMLIAVAAVVALAVGGVVGAMVVGPRFVPAKPAAVHAEGEGESDDHAAGAEESGGHGKGGQDKGGHGKGGGKAALIRIENIIVNPAGSQGMHFLMASVAIEGASSKLESIMRDREAQVRDVVISTLERQSMEMLARPGARDSVRKDLTTALQKLGGSRKISVYLPQFVVQ